MQSRTRSLPSDWEYIEDAQMSFNCDNLPPDVIFDGECPLAKIDHIGESNSEIPVGELYITNASLYYYSSWVSGSYECISIIPIWSIDNITLCKNTKELIPIYDGEHMRFSFVVKIFCKSLQQLKFCFDKIEPANHLKLMIDNLGLNQTQINSFAFYNKSFSSEAERYNGWNIFSIDKEYKRMNINPKKWRLSVVNGDYKTCKSYPPRVIVPHCVKDEIIKESSKYRSSGRFITLSWHHPKTGAAICRSSQPGVGILGTRCVADEAIMTALRQQLEYIQIIDCRSRINAIANVAKGGGSEYRNPACQVDFSGIDNIHVMRDALYSVCYYKKSGNGFSHYWLKGIHNILQASSSIASFIHEQNRSVLIHCSDGWDRTPQVSSISQILLDPYYRTIEGFEVLIEKEWLYFGHKFTDRCGHGLGHFWEENERSPIFLQFIDCVYQIIAKHPTEFEFNDDFLIEIMDNVYSCWFGTFLFNNHYEREHADVRRNTPSLWSYLNCPTNIEAFKNPSYRKSNSVLFKKCKLIKPHLWVHYFYRTSGVLMKESPGAAVNNFLETPSKNKLSRALGKVAQMIPNSSPANGVIVRHSINLQAPNKVEVEKRGILDCIIEDYIPS